MKVIAETAVAKKQQLTARRAHELLAGRGVAIGYTIVKELLAERRRAAAETFVPLQYKPGELAEVDFFEVEVDLDGLRTTVFLFLMRLMGNRPASDVSQDLRQGASLKAGGSRWLRRGARSSGGGWWPRRRPASRRRRWLGGTA